MIAVLTFDSASVALLDTMIESGRLPNLSSLAERGRRVELETPARDFAAGAFYTLYSGIDIGDHGLFYPFQWDARRQSVRQAGELEAPPAIWERLAIAGRRTLAIDPYECRPPRRHQGTFVSGWGFEERTVLPAWSRPEVARRALARDFGKPPRATEVFGRPRSSQLIALRSRLLDAPGRVADAAVHLLSQEQFDLAWLTFSAAHLAGHQFWDLSQLAEPWTNGDRRIVLERTLTDVYGRVDEAIGRVLRALPRDADVIVCSAVGMDVNTSRADLLPGMLAAVLSGGPLDEPSAVWRLRAALPPGLRGAVAQALPRRLALELTARLELSGVDRRGARAFAHPADNQGYIRFNLRGRERDGVVDPADAGALAEEIVAGLESFTDPDGRAAVAAIERTADRYAGEHAYRLPDLVVHWSERPATTLELVRSDRFGAVRRQGAGSGRSGNHTPDGAWAIVAPGRSALREPTRPPRLADVATSVAAICGAPRDGLGGEPLLGPADRADSAQPLILNLASRTE
ncbi:MAG TPA: alkaline phosphatase family protein [Solirubrobacterales bacterium]